MFADPQSITVNAVAQSLPRIQVNPTSSVYQKSDGTRRLTISQDSSKGRRRSLFRHDVTVVAADPVSAVNVSKTMSIYIVIDKPDFGFNQTTVEQEVAGTLAALTTAAVDKLYAGEF